MFEIKTLYFIHRASKSFQPTSTFPQPSMVLFYEKNRNILRVHKIENALKVRGHVRFKVI